MGLLGLFKFLGTGFIIYLLFLLFSSPSFVCSVLLFYLWLLFCSSTQQQDYSGRYQRQQQDYLALYRRQQQYHLEQYRRQQRQWEPSPYRTSFQPATRSEQPPSPLDPWQLVRIYPGIQRRPLSLIVCSYTMGGNNRVRARSTSRATPGARCVHARKRKVTLWQRAFEAAARRARTATMH